MKTKITVKKAGDDFWDAEVEIDGFLHIRGFQVIYPELKVFTPGNVRIEGRIERGMHNAIADKVRKAVAYGVAVF